MIAGRRVSKKFWEKEILTDVDFIINGGVKIGLVGRNGCGKSTLIKMLVGQEELTSGTISMQDEIIGYIPQEFSFEKNILAGEYLEQKLTYAWEFYRIESLAKHLKFHNFDPYQEIHTMSEGQKMKIKLIEVLLNSPTTLLIDEPTNHLDIEGIQWFEEYIKHLKINVVMISHDRSFLNHTVDEIWEIERCKLFRFVGDYDNYKSEKLKLIDKWDQEYVMFLKKKAQLEKLLENVRKIKDGKKRGNAVRSVKKRIDREIASNEKEKYVSKKIKDLEFETETRTGKLMVRFNNVTKKYGNKTVFDNMSFELRGKEKVWLFGPNGAGKTTLVKLIMNEEQPTLNDIDVGSNIKIGYFSQTQNAFDFKRTLQDAFMEITGCEFGKSYGYLSKFLFDKEAVQKRISQLSPGERSRFAFAVFAYNSYDLLILDEPDNHLDIETKEVIEKSLSEFNGAILLVSHDRYFVESVGVNKILNLKNGKMNLI